MQLFNEIMAAKNATAHSIVFDVVKTEPTPDNTTTLLAWAAN